MTPPREWLQDKLHDAILKARENDEVLFDRGACERSIMFRIGRYLAPDVEDGWPKLSVDCEYNRIASATEARVVKKVGPDRVPGDKKRSVLPDLIVHDRSGSSSEQNILVVEAKKYPVGRGGEAYDRRKLKAYQSELQYQYAVYLELGRDPRWQWMDHDPGLQRVFSPSRASGGNGLRRGGCTHRALNGLCTVLCPLRSEGARADRAEE